MITHGDTIRFDNVVCQISHYSHMYASGSSGEYIAGWVQGTFGRGEPSIAIVLYVSDVCSKLFSIQSLCFSLQSI